MTSDSRLATLQKQVLGLEKFLKDGINNVTERFSDVAGMTVEQGKVFLVNGLSHTYDYAVLLSDANDRIWACPKGIVLREEASGASLVVEDLNVTLRSCYAWPDDLRHRIYALLPPHAQTLVQWDVARWAVHTRPNSIKGIKVPERETLDAAFRSLYSSTDKGSKGPLPGPMFTPAKPSNKSDTTSAALALKRQVQLATIQSLQYKVGVEYKDFLPKLEQLNLSKQNVEDYQLVSLHIGAYADTQTKTVRTLHLLIKQQAPLDKSPAIITVLGQAITDANIEHEKITVKNTGTQIDTAVLPAMAQEGRAILLWPFRYLTKPNDLFRATIKYCFILAAESDEYDFHEHCVPESQPFVKDLKASCKKIEGVKDKSWGMQEYSKEIKKLSNKLQPPTTDLSPRLQKKIDRVATLPTRPESQSRASTPTIPKRNEVKRNQGPATSVVVMSNTTPHSSAIKEYVKSLKAQHVNLEDEQIAVREMIARHQERAKEIEEELPKVLKEILKYDKNPGQYRR